MQLLTLLIQDVSTAETRAALAGAMLLDHQVTVRRSSLEDLSEPETVALLKAGATLAVGSVEFVREAMRLADIAEPENLSYPDELTDFLRRDVREVRAGQVLGRHFVKPRKTKAFTGFVFDTMQDPDTLPPDVRPDYAAFMALPADTPVWISEPVIFLSEWRYYVKDGVIIGRARYDLDGAESVPQPDEAEILSAIKAFGAKHPYAIDFGVLEGGDTALVEVNDAWAIGLYGHALTQRQYLEFLRERWDGLHEGREKASQLVRRARKP
jgi:hypothetical protein